MIPCLLVAAWTMPLTAVQAQEKLVANYSWKTLTDAGEADAALIKEEPGHGQVCVVTNAKSEPLRKTLVTIKAPAITADWYRLAGEVRYDGVEGDSYLEMWSTFPPANPGGSERSYFSRTLAESNQMGKLHGTSDWREFSLPFNATGSGAHPSQLTFNLVLVGKGTVAISGLKLWQSPAGAAVGSLPNGLMLAAGGTVAVVTVPTLLLWRRRRARQNEARRMAAHDILA